MSLHINVEDKEAEAKVIPWSTLYVGMEFTVGERRFLEDNDGCSLATVYPNGRPHVVPVNYLFLDGFFYIATDYNTQKLKNIRLNNKVALVVAVYRPNRAIVIEGEASILEQGSDFEKIYRLFYKRFSWVRADPWREGEAPFIRIKPLRKISWGL